MDIFSNFLFGVGGCGLALNIEESFYSESVSVSSGVASLLIDEVDDELPSLFTKADTLLSLSLYVCAILLANTCWAIA